MITNCHGCAEVVGVSANVSPWKRLTSNALGEAHQSRNVRRGGICPDADLTVCRGGTSECPRLTW